LCYTFRVREEEEKALPSFVEQIYVIIFCVINGIGIRRFKRAGCTSNWIENLNERDADIMLHSNFRKHNRNNQDARK